MGGKPNKPTYPHFKGGAPTPAVSKKPVPVSLLDKMVDGREFQSIVGLKNVVIDFDAEIKRAISDISAIRNRRTICYIANTLNVSIAGRTSISIDNTDDGPFDEMLKTVPEDEKDIDIILVTPGGSADTVDHFVHKLRDRFEHVAFILPYMAMSAGTIFCLSGDELIMSESAYIGPIDPQVPSKNGAYVPAQSIFTLIDTIKQRGIEQMKKGLQPDWTDVALLKNIDPKEIGNAINASALSMRLVTEYLRLYKFRDWTTHQHDGSEVTPEQRDARAAEIAAALCDNSVWLSHGSRISREIAVNKCQLRIKYPEEIPGLDRAIRRFWALMMLTLENNPISKFYATGDYLIVRSVNTNPVPTK